MTTPDALPNDEPSGDEPNREQLLAAVLARMIDHSHHGDEDSLHATTADHPQLAEELRDLYSIAQLADDLAASLSEDPGAATRSDSAARRDFATRTFSLPQTFGDYELLEELGRGGMGIVFKARQISLGRIVALKMVLRGELASGADVARFRAEAESAARLNHPHIVPVYEVGEHEGQPYFSMQYIDGSTLSQRLTAGPLAPREAAAILAPICRAIEEAHRHGLLHRDLKPSNILIDRDGRSYVTDFGLAKRVTVDAAEENAELQAITHSGAILGTPGYMAPEQAAGQRGEVGIATDVYGLGAVLYAMLTSRAPFQSTSPLDTVFLVLEQDPLPPRLLNRRSDPDLEMIALKCLQKPGDLRYADAGALARDLEAYLANEPISARSGKFSQVLSRAFRETHHAGVLENWGLLWMWHSLVLIVLCTITNAMQWWRVESRLPYVALWTLGLGLWAIIFWNIRRRSGPTTFVERQIAHVWAGSMISSTMLYAVEAILQLPVLTLSPVLGIVSGMVFLVKAAILSGAFYVQATALFATAIAMALIQARGLPNFGILLFGIVSAVCFFFPGLKYYRQRNRGLR